MCMYGCMYECMFGCMYVSCMVTYKCACLGDFLYFIFYISVNNFSVMSIRVFLG